MSREAGGTESAGQEQRSVGANQDVSEYGLAGGLRRPTGAERIMIALDVPTAEDAWQLLETLGDTAQQCWVKVGMELYYACGPEMIRELKSRGFRVFADLKLHDIPNTVRGAAAAVSRLGVDMLNVHAAGGVEMMEAARLGAEEGAAVRWSEVRESTEVGEQGSKGDDLRQSTGSGGQRPLLIAVTQLTSTDAEMMNQQIGIPGKVRDSVLHYAELAFQAGLDGVVCAANEASMLKRKLGEDWLTVTPGIRPQGVSADDQKRTMTPAAAISANVDYMVIGRPITRVEQPLQALQQIILEIKGAEEANANRNE